MKKNTFKIGVFLVILLTAGALVVVSRGFINKKTETFGSNSQPKIEKTNNQPYIISGTINKVSL